MVTLLVPKLKTFRVSVPKRVTTHDLSERERQTIISFVIENRIQTAQDIAHLLEWLISQRDSNPRMAVALSRWRADLSFVRHYHKPTRKVRVDRIYAKL